ncbi:MAG TPA: porin family protein [Puia sp.]
MSKNLPHIDEIYRDAIDGYEEHPSPDVWRRLQAQLDEEDVAAYKKKYIAARRAAISLAILLLFLVIQETGIIRPAVSLPIGPIRLKNDLANETVKDNAEGKRPQKIAAGRKLLVIQPSGYITDTCCINGKPGNAVPCVKLLGPDSLNRMMAHTAGVADTAGAAGAIRQKAKERRPFKPYWSVTVLSSQEWAQYRLENGGNVSQDESTDIAQKERHEPSFTAGALVLYQFKRNWGIQAGLLYSGTSIAIDPQEIYAVKAPDGAIAYKYNSSSGYAFVKPGFGLPPAVGDSLSAASAQHNLQYIGIPVTLQYKITKGRFSFSPGLGVSFNFLAGARIKTEVENAGNRETVTIDKLQGTKTFYLGLMANANLQYDFSKKWALTIRPGFSYALTSITKNNVVKTYPYSFGAAAGLTYKF